MEVNPEERLDIEGIMEIIPHRYPFLLVDRYLGTFDDGKLIRGYKNVSINEPFFQGHFPAQRIMPGVLILEALAQLGAVHILSQPEHRGRLAYLMSIDGAKFRRPVVPGDRMDMELEALKFRKRFGKVRGTATVEGEIAAQAEISFALGQKK